MSVDTEHRRRRIRLTALPSIPIEFTGTRAGDGPLTLGQRNIMQWLSRTPDHFYAVLCVELPVPPSTSVADVTEAIAILVARHETLRTTYADDQQCVAASGVLPLEICALGDGPWGPRDRPTVAEALVRWLRETPDPARPAMRVVVATADADRQVVACAAAFRHLTVDHGAIEILRREFADLLGDPARRQVGPPRHQPLDQANREATPNERRRAEAALDYLREQSQRIPRCLYALPGARPGGESLAVELSSVAAAMAARHVAARTRTSRSAIVTAAVCAVVAHRAGYRELVLPLLSSNRFEGHLVDYVGALAQGTIATVPVADRGFDDLVRHTWRAVMEASRHARYDGARRAATDERIEHERGLRFNYDPLVNSLVPESWSGFTAGVGHQPDEIDAALGKTVLTWRPVPRNGTPIRFGLNQIDGTVRLDAWTADTGLIPQAELTSVLLAVERVLVAAGHGDIAADRMPELIGLAPLTGPDRFLVDSCWVDLAAAQELMTDALTPAVTRVFHTHSLMAYVAATDSVRTPEQAHARCLAALPDHPTAITPQHYVICDTAPADPTVLDAWPPPTAAGSGRSTN